MSNLNIINFIQITVFFKCMVSNIDLICCYAICNNVWADFFICIFCNKLFDGKVLLNGFGKPFDECFSYALFFQPCFSRLKSQNSDHISVMIRDHWLDKCPDATLKLGAIRLLLNSWGLKDWLSKIELDYSSIMFN